MSRFGRGHDFKERHTSSVVVNEHLITLVDALSCVLFHLDALNENVVLIFLEIVEEEAAIKHDWVMLLRDLISLRQVSVNVVFPVELDLWKNASTQSQRSLDGEIKALFVENGEHTWQTKIDEVGVSVRLLTRCVQGGCDKRRKTNDKIMFARFAKVPS